MIGEKIPLFIQRDSHMTEASASQDNNAQAENVGFGTKPYRTFVLSALTLIYILNFVDRGLLAVVGPDLIPELVSPIQSLGC